MYKYSLGAAKTGTHKDTKSHNVNIRVLSGIDSTKKEALERYQKVLKEIELRKFLIEQNKEYKYSLIKAYGLRSYASNLNKSKAYIAELKKHATELKKHI